MTMETRTAREYDSASGRKNAPVRPSRKSTGTTATTLISVAYVMALRTSTDASRTTRTVLRSPPARFWRSRLTMFSMSMMASSTTTPTAITSPARTIVLMVASRTSSTVSAPSSDNGIATALMTALRHSKRNSSRITMTRRAPRNSALVRLSMAISMNVAGRKIVLSTSTPGRPGSSCCSTSSTPSVTSSVLAHGSFSTMSISPSPSLITASPFSGWWLVSMSATSLRVTALPPPPSRTTTSPSCSEVKTARL